MGRKPAESREIWRFGFDESRFYIGSLVLILEALHIAGVAYRDLKPEARPIVRIVHLSRIFPRSVQHACLIHCGYDTDAPSN